MAVVKKSISKKEVKTNPVKKAKNSKLSLDIYSIEGNVEKSVELPKEIFDFRSNPKLLAQYIRVYRANQRQGNASTKTRGEVTGSTRKIYRQKGTGRARHGSIKAPIFVGGGVVGGPKPRDYSLKINKKQRTQALFSSLTLKQKDNAIFGFTYEAKSFPPKTKLVVKFLKKLGNKSKNILFVLPKIEKNNFILATRNIKDVTMIDGMSLNAYEILKAQTILINDEALDVLKKQFIKK